MHKIKIKRWKPSGKPGKALEIDPEPKRNYSVPTERKYLQIVPPAGKTVKKIYVVDVKSVKSFDYLDEPKREHVLQLTFYLRVLREQFPGICGKLIYIKKDDFSMKEFDVPYDDKNWRELIARLSILHRTLTTP